MGVAPSAWLAKCAAEANKPDAAVVWRRDDLPAVYADLKLEALPGAGPRICARLRAAGLTTVEAIHAASRSRVIDAWGSIDGERVRLALQGEDVPARVTRRRSVAHGRVLTGGDRCWREARPIVRWLAVCALHRCAEGGQRPGRVRLEVVTVGGAVRGGLGRLDGQGSELDLLRAVSTLWDDAAASGPHDPPARVGVVLEALRDRSAASLFEADPRERRLQWMLDRVRDRYGARSLLWGECADLVRQANWQKVGGASPPKRRSNQATFLREPCVGPREGAGEASVAVRMGRAIEHRKRIDPGCRGFQIGRRQHCRHRFGEMSADPAVSENPCTFARLVSGPWEVFRLPHMS